jgi:hypothetical protein
MKTKKKIETKETTPRISFETYRYITSLIDAQMTRLEINFQTATWFIPDEPYKLGKMSGLDKAHKVFSDENAKLRKMKDELHLVAQQTYKDHPNPEMRKFWGVE